VSAGVLVGVGAYECYKHCSHIVSAVRAGENPAHPKGPALTQDEADAFNHREQGQPFDEAAYNRARQKIKQGEKLANIRRNRPGKDKK
jgi:hypothetical protein